MFVGRLDVRTKGLDILVEAFAVSRRGGLVRPARLVLAGPDWQGGRAAVTELARRHGVADHVEVLGVVPADGIVALFEACDLYVQLSRNEGSPLSVNDALALGKPAILSNRIGTASCDEVARQPHVKIVEPTVAAASAAIAEGVANLAALEQEARDAGPALREFLSWERAARLHLDAYASLVVRPRG
jgi:glycosyltransferase involved in cell wall biosynthesis